MAAHVLPQQDAEVEQAAQAEGDSARRTGQDGPQAASSDNPPQPPRRVRPIQVRPFQAIPQCLGLITLAVDMASL
jgi:hypothetical protein